MRNQHLIRLSLGKRLALSMAALATTSTPIVVGILSEPTLDAQATTDWQTKAGDRKSVV